MQQTNGGLGFVSMLPTSATGAAIELLYEILFFAKLPDRRIALKVAAEDRDRDSRAMDASVSLGHGNTLDFVTSPLRFERGYSFPLDDQE